MRLGDHHALAGGEPVGLHDVETRQRLEERERLGLLARVERGVPRGSGRPRPRSTSFIQALEPSSLAAAIDGPNTVAPLARRSSVSPSTSGASGPITTRSNASSSVDRVRRAGGTVPSSAIPGLPGAAVDRVDRRRPVRAPTPARARAHPNRRRGRSRRDPLRGAGQHDRLVARRAYRHEADVHAGVLLDELHVVTRSSAGDPRCARRARSPPATRAASRRSAGPCAEPTGGTGRGRTACRSRPRTRRRP